MQMEERIDYRGCQNLWRSVIIAEISALARSAEIAGNPRFSDTIRSNARRDVEKAVAWARSKDGAYVAALANVPAESLRAAVARYANGSGADLRHRQRHSIQGSKQDGGDQDG